MTETMVREAVQIASMQTTVDYLAWLCEGCNRELGVTFNDWRLEVSLWN